MGGSTSYLLWTLVRKGIGKLSRGQRSLFIILNLHNSLVMCKPTPPNPSLSLYVVVSCAQIHKVKKKVKSGFVSAFAGFLVTSSEHEHVLIHNEI